MKRFDNQTVIVTGGARGMGASHARGFVAEGANVVIADVLEQEGRTLADDLGEHAIFSRLDVTSDRDWAATVAAAEDAFGPVGGGFVHSPDGWTLNWFGKKKGEGIEYFVMLLSLLLIILVKGSGAMSIDLWLTRTAR
jgi:NAD(P)-dependent dehydrogenase (short-subunit alcohol dehydrogenase family)